MAIIHRCASCNSRPRDVPNGDFRYGSDTEVRSFQRCRSKNRSRITHIPKLYEFSQRQILVDTISD